MSLFSRYEDPARTTVTMIVLVLGENEQHGLEMTVALRIDPLLGIFIIRAGVFSTLNSVSLCSLVSLCMYVYTVFSYEYMLVYFFMFACFDVELYIFGFIRVYIAQFGFSCSFIILRLDIMFEIHLRFNIISVILHFGLF